MLTSFCKVVCLIFLKKWYKVHCSLHMFLIFLYQLEWQVWPNCWYFYLKYVILLFINIIHVKINILKALFTVSKIIKHYLDTFVSSISTKKLDFSWFFLWLIKHFKISFTRKFILFCFPALKFFNFNLLLKVIFIVLLLILFIIFILYLRKIFSF